MVLIYCGQTLMINNILKNPVFVNKEVVDFFGTNLCSGDIIAYSSKNKMRIGIFLGVLKNKNEDLSIAIQLVPGHDIAHHGFKNSHLIVIPIVKTASIFDKDKAVVLENVILINSEFHVNNKTVQIAMKELDNLKDIGLIS